MNTTPVGSHHPHASVMLSPELQAETIRTVPERPGTGTDPRFLYSGFRNEYCQPAGATTADLPLFSALSCASNGHPSTLPRPAPPINNREIAADYLQKAEYCIKNHIAVGNGHSDAADTRTGETPLTSMIRRGDDIGLHRWFDLKRFCAQFPNHPEANAVRRTLSSENALNLRGELPLSVAIQQNRPDVVEILLRFKGLDLNFPEFRRQRTPLFWAVEKRSYDAVRMLARASSERTRSATDPYPETVDPNIPDNHGATPLHVAVVNQDTEMVALLLAIEGINPNAVDAMGQRPVDLVDWRRSSDIGALLSEPSASTRTMRHPTSKATRARVQ